MTMAPKWQAVQQMTDEELYALYDQVAEHTTVGLSYYRDEITHREFERASKAAHELAAASLTEAKASTHLAKMNMIVAIVATAIAIAALLAQFLLG